MNYTMSGYLFALALCLVLVGFLFLLLRNRRIKEKYAGLWIVVAIGVAILGAVPAIPVWLASAVGVELPVNLVFALALLVLLIVCVQLSVGVSALDERVRTLTEEVALLRLDAQRGQLDPTDESGASRRDGPAGQDRPTAG